MVESMVLAINEFVCLIWGNCFVFVLKLCSDRQLSLFLGKITHIRLQSLFSQTKCKHEEEQRTINMEEGQKGNSGTWTFEDITAQKLVAVHLEMLDKNT